MSDFSYEIALDEITVWVPFVLRRFFMELFKTAKWSGEIQAHVVTNSAINLFKLEQFEKASKDVTDIKAEVEELKQAAEELEYTILGIEEMKKELAEYKRAHEKYIKDNKSIDLLKQMYEKLHSEAIAEFHGLNSSSSEQRAKLEGVISSYNVMDQVMDLSEILHHSSPARLQTRLDSIRASIMKLYEMIRDEMRLDFRALRRLAQEVPGHFDQEEVDGIMARLYIDVEVLNPHC
ncbi:hypothetical protein ACIQAL_09385 [Pseudomonas sp. NPDC088368]|uniref:hypothetical protein n=1 Tax=Pseudomonas sp. NPDC088368 TaxID=3364453 RepID=UPI00380FC389